MKDGPFHHSDQPVSTHDIRVIHGHIVRLHYDQHKPPIVEVHMSARRLRDDGVRVLGYPVRRVDGLPLNEGVIVVDGREQARFNFEDA